MEFRREEAIRTGVDWWVALFSLKDMEFIASLFDEFCKPCFACL
jgi:hypothetical protein